MSAWIEYLKLYFNWEIHITCNSFHSNNRKNSTEKHPSSYYSECKQLIAICCTCYCKMQFNWSPGKSLKVMHAIVFSLWPYPSQYRWKLLFTTNKHWLPGWCCNLIVAYKRVQGTDKIANTCVDNSTFLTLLLKGLMQILHHKHKQNGT